MEHELTKCFGRIELTPLSLDGAERLRVLRNKNSGNFFDPAPITRERQQLWYQKYLSLPGDYMFSVCLRSTGQWIGAAGLYNMDQAANCVEFGRLLIDRENTQERGLGAEVTHAACLLAFEKLAVDLVLLEVYADNLPALRTYQKCGFSETARTQDEQQRQIVHMALQNRKEGIYHVYDPSTETQI